jgi:hypothetical protein
MSQQIESIHTCCKDCVFAKYDGNTQTDCALDYISIYRQKNIEVIEAYDNEKEFFVINNKKCIGYRKTNWFNRMGLTNDSLEEKIKKYHEMNFINYAIIIDTVNYDLTDLNVCIKKISELNTQPRKLLIIRYAYNDQKNLTYSNIESLLKEYNIDCEWRIQTMLDQDMTHDDILYQAINQNSQYRFILYYSNPNSDINNIVNTANDIVSKQLDQFHILSSSDHQTYMFSTATYKYAIYHGKNILKETNYFKIL